MSELLDKLGFKKKTRVGISLSANNFVELVCVDRKTKSVVKYASGNIKYNGAIREIIDYDEFTEVVEGLFDEAGLDANECSVTINLPNVHFGITSLDSVSETPFIIDNLQSEIEDLYVFKRNEPIISYSVIDSGKSHGNNKIIFSAIQQKVVVRLIEIIEGMGAEISRIDTGYSSLLKAVQYCDRFNKYVQKEEKTTLLLITPNSCCSFYLISGAVVDFFEEPLAVKSFSTEEVYTTISKIAENAISSNSSQNLLIISEADEVNPELLSSRLNFNGEIDCVNKSINSNDQFIDISEGSDVDTNMITYMTIESVGAAVSEYDDYPLSLNFLPDEKINKNMATVGDYEVDIYKFGIVVVGLALVLALIIVGLVNLILGQQIEGLSSSQKSSKKQIDVFKKRIKENTPSKNKKNIFPILKQVIEQNNSTVDIYTSLSTDIPEHIYIKRFVTNADGGVGILGESKTSEAVNDFVRTLREKNPDLMLSKLSVNTKDDLIPAKIKNGFTFEIKTSSTSVFFAEDEAQQNLLNAQRIINQSNQNNKTKNTKNNTGSSRKSLTPPPPVI